MYIKLDAATYPSLGSRFDDSFFKFLWQPNVACPEKGIMFYLYCTCRAVIHYQTTRIVRAITFNLSRLYRSGSSNFDGDDSREG